ncbi:hypothetical protein TeGR_g15005, partial [Tetraparma gracilis]
AFESVPTDSASAPVAASYRACYDSLLSTFASLNVTEIPTVGSEFDAELHQAIAQLPSEDHGSGVVCQEFAKGYVRGDKLIRPAMVAVAL